MATTIVEQTESEVINHLLSFEALPFVLRHEWNGASGGSNWHLPEGDVDYGDACTIGKQWANLFLEYMESNPIDVGSGGILGSIVRCMKEETGGRRGYAVGFFSRLERALAR